MDSTPGQAGAGPSSARQAPSRLTRPRLYEQIVEQLVEHIRAQSLGPGDRLPPERELAQAIGVSRASLAQALVALEVVGLVRVRHGEGVIILRQVDSGDTLLDAVRTHQDSLPDVIDARSALETRLAALAARRRTDEDLRAIDDALDLMDRQVAAGDRGLDGDRAFHEAVTRAGHSRLLARLMTEISELILETRIESLSQPDRPRTSLENHRAIADAIRHQDPIAAAMAMADHIELVSDVALLREPRA